MSTKSVAEKLRIKPDSTLWASPASRVELIGPLPEGVRVIKAPQAANVTLLFAEDAASLQARLADHGPALREAGAVWVSYPKGNKADINRDSIPPALTEYGMTPIGQIAVDEVWSALRFRPLKPGEAPFRSRCIRAPRPIPQTSPETTPQEKP